MDRLIKYRLDLMEAREVPGMGFGVFARQNIPKGTRLLAETPVCAIDHIKPTNREEFFHLMNMISSISGEELRELNQLHYSLRQLYSWVEKMGFILHYVEETCDKDKTADEKRTSAAQLMLVCAKFYTNCGQVSATAYTDRPTSGIWSRFSRFNHSCNPNCTWDVLGDESVLTVTAERDIVADEEIFISYIADVSSRKLWDRRDHLKHWGFKCECSKCKHEEKIEPPPEKEFDLYDDFDDLKNRDILAATYTNESDRPNPDRNLFLPHPNYGEDAGLPTRDDILHQLEMNREIGSEVHLMNPQWGSSIHGLSSSTMGVLNNPGSSSQGTRSSPEKVFPRGRSSSGGSMDID
ncbi:hypothetical protein F5B19DRAFT_93175 [Rostrohypoxylon terebratum]|nr:hypothetical protein F5B19DRAFT_93175 [Rostrohypoxylon terebratum]